MMVQSCSLGGEDWGALTGAAGISSRFSGPWRKIRCVLERVVAVILFSEVFCTIV